MKYAGEKVEGPNIEMVFIPRQDRDLVFKCRAVLDADYELFDKLCPEPEPPMVTRPGNITTPNFNDKEFIKATSTWAENRTNFMIIISLSETEELEWESVDVNVAETWKLYREELQGAGFTGPEIGRLLGGVTTACGLNDAKVDEARERFLASQLVEPLNG